VTVLHQEATSRAPAEELGTMFILTAPAVGDCQVICGMARKPSKSETISILIADLTSRQQEIIERGRSENYLFVLYFTALGGIVAGVAVLQSLDAASKGALGPNLPTFVLLGSLAMIALPVDLVHLAYGTELRRVYIQTHLEPKFRELLTDHSELAAFSYEKYDRVNHLKWSNALIVVRTGFVWLPSTILFGYFLTLRFQKLPSTELDWMIEIAVILTGVIAIIFCIGSFFKVNSLIIEERGKNVGQ